MWYSSSDDEQAGRPPCMAEPRTSTGRSMPVVFPHTSPVSHLIVTQLSGWHPMYEWDTGSKSMQVRLDQVFHPGQTCSYEYDFGSTIELTLKAISEREVVAKKKALEILAQNNLPRVPCDVRGEPATNICTRCIYEDQGYLCDACAKDHKCGEEMLLPIVNSPRAGLCGYTGQESAYADPLPCTYWKTVSQTQTTLFARASS